MSQHVLFCTMLAVHEVDMEQCEFNCKHVTRQTRGSIGSGSLLLLYTRRPQFCLANRSCQSVAMLNLPDRYADADLQQAVWCCIAGRFTLKSVHDYLAKATANAST